MTFNSENFTELHRKNMETAMRLAQLSIDNSQRVMALQAELAKTLFDSSVSSAKAQAAVKNPQDLMRLQADYARDTAQRVVEMAKQVAEIGNSARSEFSHLLTEQLASGKEELSSSLQGFMKNLPAGIPNMSQAFEQAVATANSAFEQISKVSAAAMGSASAASKKGKKST